ncbi:MAG: hypothetical protein OXH65_01250 [Paracoccaceae bacterium]|nr:hypothetical protein [Paracoccaceae bacterium]MDE2673716.1 hypothetical protein [Paracoccaceae bacterium]
MAYRLLISCFGIILPGRGDDGGPPTLLEIEILENRYQLQNEGKSEYSGFDRAISIRRKIEIGFEVKDQIKDDPQFVNATEAEIQKAIKEIEKNFLNPLKCADRYLKQFEREKQYYTISSSKGDREGRWQAFIDYSNTYHTKFKKESYLLESNVEEHEIGDIEEAAFNIIRLRNVPGMPKVHQIMRDLHKYCSKHESKMELLKLSTKVSPTLPLEDQFEDEHMQVPLPREAVDDKWVAKNKENITYHLNRAKKHWDSEREKETVIDLLEAALKKLLHENMDLSLIEYSDLKNAKRLTKNIQETAKNLEKEIFEIEKKSSRQSMN